jgi:hypothetical protein
MSRTINMSSKFLAPAPAEPKVTYYKKPLISQGDIGWSPVSSALDPASEMNLYHRVNGEWVIVGWVRKVENVWVLDQEPRIHAVPDADLARLLHLDAPVCSETQPLLLTLLEQWNLAKARGQATAEYRATLLERIEAHHAAIPMEEREPWDYESDVSEFNEHTQAVA